MDTGIENTFYFFKWIILVPYVLVGLGVILYGIYSFITKSSRIYEDEGASYKASLKFSIIKSVLDKTPYWHRIFSEDNVGVEGQVGRLMGLVYIVIGVMMLTPLIWAYFKLQP